MTPTERTSQNIDPATALDGQKTRQRRVVAPDVSTRARSPSAVSAGPRPSAEEPFRVIKPSFEVVEGLTGF